MQAMDAELVRIKRERQLGDIATKNSPVNAYQDQCTQKGVDSDEEDMDAMEAMVNDDVGEGSLDYTLMKNFLESFKSQQGLPGPVSNLIGRLGGQLPRDNT